jgi:S1-C subfamily serine protease
VYKTSLLAVLTALACATSHPPKALPTTLAPVQSPEVFKFSDHAHTTRLAALVIDLPVGYRFGTSSGGYYGGCNQSSPNVNTDGRIELDIKRYSDVFITAMKEHGYPVDAQSEIFKESQERVADLQIAARIIELTVNDCYPNISRNKLEARGDAYMKVEWSAYSSLEKKVTFTMTTEGVTPGEVISDVGQMGILRAAFVDAARRLALSKEYRAAIDPPAAPATQTASNGSRIRVHGASLFGGTLKDHLDAIKQAVATVRANRGSGSGFVISGDGVVLTAEHVVSGSKFAKINTAAGKECYGEVVASSKQRDLALIKVDCGPLQALPIVREAVGQGSDVFAAGTPLSEQLQFSVTKGVVSGMRNIDSLDFIQSDVTVLPGNSGGPLLDAHGNAIGVAALMAAAGDAPLHVNLFIPIRDLPKYLPVDLD